MKLLENLATRTTIAELNEAILKLVLLQIEDVTRSPGLQCSETIDSILQVTQKFQGKELILELFKIALGEIYPFDLAFVGHEAEGFLKSACELALLQANFEQMTQQVDEAIVKMKLAIASLEE